MCLLLLSTDYDRDIVPIEGYVAGSILLLLILVVSFTINLLPFSCFPILFHAHCVKSLRIWSFSGPYFPAFGLSTEYGEILRISRYSVQMWENTD